MLKIHRVKGKKIIGLKKYRVKKYRVKKYRVKKIIEMITLLHHEYHQV
jgi:hypothetical protein